MRCVDRLNLQEKADIQRLADIFPLILGPEQIRTASSPIVSSLSMMSSAVGAKQSLRAQGAAGGPGDAGGAWGYFLRDISIPLPFSGGRGCRFKSGHPDQQIQIQINHFQSALPGYCVSTRVIEHLFSTEISIGGKAAPRLLDSNVSARLEES